MRQREYKLSLFADDILLTLTHSHLSLLSLDALVTEFSLLSGYKINTFKTEALLIYIPPEDLSPLQKSYPYHWCSLSL